MTKTDYFEGRILNHVTRGLNLGALTTYLGLLKVAPGEAAATGTECDYTGYTRMALSTSNFGSASTGGSITSSATVTFPANGGSAQNIVAVAIYDASTSGNMLYYQLLTTIPLGAAETPRFVAGNIVINEE